MKIFKVTKKTESGSVELHASESQLDQLRKDPRFTIGEELRSAKQEAKPAKRPVDPDHEE